MFLFSSYRPTYNQSSWESQNSSSNGSSSGMTLDSLREYFECTNYCLVLVILLTLKPLSTRVGVKYSTCTCTWYLYLSTYLSVLDVLEYLVYGNAKVLVLVLVLDQKVLGTYK